MAPYAAPTPPHDDHAAFINEARRNLLLLGAVSGPYSLQYCDLVRCYRDVAEQLGCGPRFERVLEHIGHEEGRDVNTGR